MEVGYDEPAVMARRVELTDLVAIGFALGSLEHAVGFVLLLFGVEMYAGYPAWRHAAFTFVDGLIAVLAVRQPKRLFVPLLAFLIEQVVVNGTFAWRMWRTSGEILWVVVVMLLLVGAAVSIAARARQRDEAAEAPTRTEWRERRSASGME